VDLHHFCIPTLAAVDERSGRDRWQLGIDATNVVGGNGIRVFRNGRLSSLECHLGPLWSESEEVHSFSGHA